jgi:hypothetical protein
MLPHPRNSKKAISYQPYQYQLRQLHGEAEGELAAFTSALLAKPLHREL